jgi:thymidine kinase
MYAGKTTKLLNLYKQNKGIILDYSEENGEGYMYTHDHEGVLCLKRSTLMDSVWITDGPLYINEAQFFPDLVEFVKKWELFYDIFIFGLDGDYQRKPFGPIIRVLPLCDTVEKLKGLCEQCQSPSLFSKRITDHRERILFDESAYIPLCRSCYLNPNRKV